MRVAPFEIERYYERWEFRAELMLSSSDCESRSVAALLELEPDVHERLLDLRLGYTEVAGSPELRAAIAAGYERCSPEDVLSLAAAEEGIFLVYHALLADGDHAIIETPCYSSALELARSTGAMVSEWGRRYEEGWEHDLDALAALLRPETKLIYINSPHNPTGTTMAREVFERICELASERGIALFSDEVYRGLEHERGARLPTAADQFEHAISLGSVSKAYGLPGLRTGWLVSRDRRLLERVRELKLYTTICSSAPSELLSAVALRNAESLVGQSRELVLENLASIDGLMHRREQLLQWVRPTGGPIGFPRVASGVDVRAFCERAAERAGVLLLPGDVYGCAQHLRLGFGRLQTPQAIERFEAYLEADAAAAS